MRRESFSSAPAAAPMAQATRPSTAPRFALRIVVLSLRCRSLNRVDEPLAASLRQVDRGPDVAAHDLAVDGRDLVATPALGPRRGPVRMDGQHLELHAM